MGEKIAEKVYQLEIAKEKWTEIQTVSKESGNFRFNHTAVYFEGKIYLFGGETITLSNFTSRTLLNDVRILDLSTLVWVSVPPGQNFVTPRRNHSCALYKSFMMIHGGLSVTGQTLNDFWIFNLKHFKWENFKLAGGVFPALCYHTMILVESVNSVKDFGTSLPVEGIFIFGGKKGADFISSNDIYVIPLKKSMTRALESYFLQTTKEAFTKKYGMLSHYWFKLPTVGTPPCPRYSHHASFLQHKS